MLSKLKYRKSIITLSLALVAAIGIACSTAVDTPVNNSSSDGPSAPPAQQVAVEPVSPEPSTDNEPLTSGEVDTLERNPDFAIELRNAGLSSRGWNTDFGLHIVPFDEITFVIPRDGIPALDNPKFVTPEEAEDWLNDQEPVVSFELNGDAKAYPLQIMTWHEIVNDEVGDVPVSATFCPLCNSAIVFDRRFDGEVLDFGVSGNLRNSDLIMYDRQTHSWWQQFTGEGIVGKHAGRNLEALSAFIISFEDFKEVHPEGKVLSRQTGFARNYGENPYSGYDRADNPPFLFSGDTDGRLLPKERVVAITIDDVDAAFPLTRVQEEKAINYSVNDQDVVVFFNSGTTSALDGRSIANSRDVGATAVFDPNINGQKLTFRAEDNKIIDNETGSAWNIVGQAIEGPMAGEQLTPVVHGDHFWFAWAAFKPDTLIYRGQS